MGESIWPSILLSTGIFSVVGILIGAVFARAKTGAETTKIANEAAGIAWHNLRNELEKTVELSTARGRQIAAMERFLEEDERWHRVVLSRLREHDITGIPDPPRLWLMDIPNFVETKREIT